MRALTRSAVALLAATALLTLAAGTALAGGWAEATLAPAGGDPPVAGEERELRVTLLQHGVTPVNFGDVQLTATNPSTGEATTVAATSLGRGEWAATVAFPTDGTWEIVVTHSDLEIGSLASLSVAEAPSLTWLPAALAIGGLVAMVAIGLVAAAATRSRGRSQPREAPAQQVGAGG